MTRAGRNQGGGYGGRAAGAARVISICRIPFSGRESEGDVQVKGARGDSPGRPTGPRGPAGGTTKDAASVCGALRLRLIDRFCVESLFYFSRPFASENL